MYLADSFHKRSVRCYNKPLVLNSRYLSNRAVGSTNFVRLDFTVYTEKQKKESRRLGAFCIWFDLKTQI